MTQPGIRKSLDAMQALGVSVILKITVSVIVHVIYAVFKHNCNDCTNANCPLYTAQSEGNYTQ